MRWARADRSGGTSDPRQRRLLNQLSLVAAGCVRLTISPACRYSALSSRMARSRSKPGQLAISRRLLVCTRMRVTAAASDPALNIAQWAVPLIALAGLCWVYFGRGRHIGKRPPPRSDLLADRQEAMA